MDHIPQTKRMVDVDILIEIQLAYRQRPNVKELGNIQLNHAGSPPGPLGLSLGVIATTGPTWRLL